MIVTKRRSPRERAQRAVDDLLVGDMVFNYVTKTKGAVMAVDSQNSLVTVDYLDGSTDTLPPAAFRRCREVGHQYDARPQ